MVKRFFIIVALLLSLIIGVSFLFWYFQEIKPIKAVIIDKTVLTKDGMEHKSFYWVLNHERFVKPDSTTYDRAKDYFGFFPKENELFYTKDFKKYSDSALTKIATNNHLLYYTDSYGMYYNEWYKKNNPSDRSKLLYGGLKMNELKLIKKFKEQKKLVITEYNVFASPTPANIRREFEKETGVHWTGWTGRYFDRLDTIQNLDLPRWVVQNYKRQHNGEWPFKNGGLVFNHMDETIVVLEDGIDMDFSAPIIKTDPEWAAYYDLPKMIEYSFWFDVVSYDNSKEVKATYNVLANKRGQSIMCEHDIPLIFPAVIEQKHPSPFYYFAGDFADNPVSYGTSYFGGISAIKSFFYKNEIEDRRDFFWNFYKPLVSKIQLDYYNSFPVQANKITQEERLKYLPNRTETFSYQLSKKKRLIILTLTTIFTLTALIFLINVLGTRQYKKIIARRKRVIRGKSDILIQAIIKRQDFNNHVVRIEKQLFSKDEFKNILIERIVKTYPKLALSEQEMLKSYYMDNKLVRISLEKIKSFTKKTFYDGVEDIQTMNVKSAVILFNKILEKETDEDTIETLISAILQLRPIRGLGYVLRSNNYLSDWQQLKILSILELQESYDIPPLEKWFQNNQSHKILGVRLVRLKNKTSEIDFLLSYLDSKNAGLKAEIIKALTALQAPMYDKLIEIYDTEPFIVRKQILRSFRKNTPPNSIEFLKKCALTEDFELRQVAVIAIHKMDPEHIELNKLLVYNIIELNNIISSIPTNTAQ